MLESFEHPVATAQVRWVTPALGGRRSGPPSSPVYAATCAFPLGGEHETVPGWPATAQMLSLLLQQVDEFSDGTWFCAADFLAPDLAVDRLRIGAPMLVMEGPKVIAHAVITDVL